MAFYMNYIVKWDVLLVTLKPALPVLTTNRVGDVECLYNNDTLVGMNIFNLGLEGVTFCSEDPTIIAKVNAKIKGIVTLEQTPQFVVAEILTCDDIPETHLHKCTVNIGHDAPVQIVCGAPNARAGLKTVCAIVGAIMPNGREIVPSKLRGIASNGMLCSAKELGITNMTFNEKGIVELDAATPVGVSFFATLK